MHIRYLLCIFFVVVCVVDASTCGDAMCITGDACCNDEKLGLTCFNPLTHDCVEDRRLCGKKLGACGSTCFDQGLYDCFNNKTLCPKGMQSCGTAAVPQCYNPQVYGCVRYTDGQAILIDKRAAVCGDIGYNPQNYSCDAGDIGDIPIISKCGVGQGLCGSECYDPQMYECVGNSLKSRPGVCGVGLLWCQNQCYDPTRYNCVNNNLTLTDNITHACPSGQNTCGSACYDATVFTCFAGNVLCNVNMQACGVACYDTNRYECTNNTLTGRPGYCGAGLSLCGSRCYSASDYNCVRGILVPTVSGTTCANKTCPSGDQCCGDAVLGSVCFNPDTHSCVGARRLCGNRLGACGNICFDMQMYTCVSPNLIMLSSRLCPFNFLACGDGQCYDPSVYQCVGDFQLTPIGMPLCGDASYNKTLYRCVDGELVWKNHTSWDNETSSSDDSGSSSDDGANNSTSSSSSSDDDNGGVCNDQQSMCVNQCYDPETHACVNGTVMIICPASEDMCGTEQCFDRNTHSCINGVVTTRVNCTEGQKICAVFGGDARCYNASEWRCLNGTVLPLVVCAENEVKCVQSCYDPSLYECIDSLVVLINNSCDTTGFLRCGNNARCFDPTLYQCVNSTLSCLHPCGSALCYNPETDACVNGVVVPYATCLGSQLRCGTLRDGVCYNPTTHACTTNNTLVCADPTYDMCAGNYCFDPLTFECVGGVVQDIHAGAGACVYANVGVVLALVLASISLFM